jgi:hypothetical protein
MPKNGGVSGTHGHRGVEPTDDAPERTSGARVVRFVTSGASRGGRRFEPIDELHLHGLIESLATSLPAPGHDVLIVPEMPSPLGLPDFVVLVGGRTWLDSRMAAGVAAALSEIECTVLASLSARRYLSVESIARRIGWASNDVEEVLVRLSRTGAVVRTSTGAAGLEPALQPAGGLFAVEAKVKDWRRAVLQGRSYRTWADNYVVVLGGMGAAAEGRATESVRHDGAGLFTSDGWLVRPRSRRPTAARRLQGFEYLFAALASDPAL